MPPALAQKKLPERPIDLNLASVEELQRLPEIGASRARAIVEFRKKSGSFRRLEDLLAIRGINRRRLEKLRPYVFISLPPIKPPGTPPKKPREEMNDRPNEGLKD